MNNEHITINNRQVFYRFIHEHFRDKNQPLLVFLHDGLGSSQQWKDFPVLLSQIIQCPALLYDRVGYGNSEPGNNLFYSLYMHDEAFDFLPELLEKLNITEKIILIGHSDGGSISLLFTARYPKKVIAVITEADHVFCEHITVEGVAGLVNDFESGNLRNKLYKHQGDKTDSLFYGWSNFWLSDEAKSWSIENHLKDIQSPVLAIQGQNDHFGTEQQLSLKLKNINSNVYIAFLENCGHVPHFEQKDHVLKAMAQFLSNMINSPP